MEPVEKRRITDYIDGFCIDSYETYEDLKENLLEPQGVKKAINTKTSPLPASREADSFPSSSSFVEAEIPRATDSAGQFNSAPRFSKELCSLGFIVWISDQGVQPINLDFSLNERGSVGSSSLDPLSTGEIKVDKRIIILYDKLFITLMVYESMFIEKHLVFENS